MDRVELWHYDDDAPQTPRCIAKTYIYMQVLDWESAKWVNVRFIDIMPKVIDNGKHFYYEYKDNGRTFILEGNWEPGNPKSTYTAKAPGERVRIQGTMLVYYPDELTVNYDDFKGVDIVDDQTTVYDRAGLQVRTITFGSDGQDDQIVVDPYIEVDEQSTYIDVTCDGYVVRISKVTGELGHIRSADNSTILWNLYQQFVVSSTYYRTHYDANRTLTILANAPNYIKIKQTGRPDSSWGGGSYLSGFDLSEIIYHIYPDKFFVENNIIISSQLTLDNNVSENRCLYMTPGTLTNADGVYGTLSETNADWQNVPSENYVVALADEANVQLIVLNRDFSGTAAYTQFTWNPACIGFGINNGTLTIGEHKFHAACIIDSATRQGSAKLYTSTERLAMGQQWKDLEL
jgi:hypothetical protein